MKRTILASLIPAMLLTACGGDSNKNETSPIAQSRSDHTEIRVIDGYLSNANVYLDKNDNGVFESTEKIGVTSESGLILVKSAELKHSLGAIAVPYETADQDRPYHAVLRTFELHAPNGSKVVSPFTDLVYREAERLKAGSVDSIDLYVAQAAQTIESELKVLGAPDNLDILSYDFVADNSLFAKKVHKVALSLVEAEKSGNDDYLTDLLPYFVSEANSLSENVLSDHNTYITGDIDDAGDGFIYVDSVRTEAYFSSENSKLQALSDTVKGLSAKVGSELHTQNIDISNLFEGKVNLEILSTLGEPLTSLNGLELSVSDTQLTISGTPYLDGINKFILKATEIVKDKEERNSHVVLTLDVEPKYLKPTLTTTGKRELERLASIFKESVTGGDTIFVELSTGELFSPGIEASSVGEERFNLSIDASFGDLTLGQLKNLPNAIEHKLSMMENVTEDDRKALETSEQWVIYGNVANNAVGNYSVGYTYQHEVLSKDGNVLDHVVVSEEFAKLTVKSLAHANNVRTLESNVFGFKASPFTAAKDLYAQCKLVKFDSGKVFSNTFQASNYSDCPQNPEYFEIGTYTSNDSEINLIIDDKSYALDVWFNSQGSTGLTAFTLTDVLGNQSYHQGVYEVAKVEDIDPIESFVFGSSTSFQYGKDAFFNGDPLYLNRLSSFIFTLNKTSKRAQYPDLVSASFVYVRGEEKKAPIQNIDSQLSLLFSRTCSELGYDDGAASKDKKLIVSEAISSKGDIFRLSRVSTHGENCAFSYDTSNDFENLSTNYTESDFFEVTIHRTPKVLNWFDPMRGSLSSTRLANDHVETLRVEHISTTLLPKEPEQP